MQPEAFGIRVHPLARLGRRGGECAAVPAEIGGRAVLMFGAAGHADVLGEAELAERGPPFLPGLDRADGGDIREPFLPAETIFAGMVGDDLRLPLGRARAG